jgi:hypothetical protein
VYALVTRLIRRPVVQPAHVLAREPDQQATEHFGSLGMVFAADIPASSTLTRRLVGWQLLHPWLIEDLDKDHYFGTQLHRDANHAFVREAKPSP